uniref:Uncharacterized protein n=1 Tax=Manihot esculenta TaxID=3983 RepID=A0A199U9P1_MANES
MVFLVLLLVIFYPFNIASATTHYNAFYLTLRWPPSFCKLYSCNTPYIEDRFTLHGLWPITLNGKSPNYKKCKKIPFNANQLIHSEIIDDLNNLWPVLETTKTNIKFWKHEWERHGVCTTWEQFRYFQTSVERVKHTHTLEMLKGSDIIPNNSVYKIVDIMQALSGLSRPIIECKKIKKDAHPMLYQVYFCLTQNGEQFQDCPPMAPHGQLGYGCDTAEVVIFPSTEEEVILPSTAISSQFSWKLYLITCTIFNVIIYF